MVAGKSPRCRIPLFYDTHNHTVVTAKALRTANANPVDKGKYK